MHPEQETELKIKLLEMLKDLVGKNHVSGILPKEEEEIEIEEPSDEDEISMEDDEDEEEDHNSDKARLGKLFGKC